MYNKPVHEQRTKAAMVGSLKGEEYKLYFNNTLRENKEMVQTEITMRHLKNSPLLKSHLLKHIEKLTHLHPAIIACHVTLACLQHRQQQGKLYTAHLSVTLAKKTLISNRKSSTDIYVAVHKAFSAIKKQCSSTH